MRLAVAIVALAFIPLLLATQKPGWAPWPGTPLPSIDIEIAAAWVAFFGVLATVIAIVAAYVELRTVFPTQRLRAELRREDRPDAYGSYRTYVIFTNDENDAVINAYRLEVTLLDENGRTFSDDIGRIHAGDEGTSWEVSTLEDIVFYRWVQSKNEPFFPGVTISGPAPEVPDGAAQWRARWWTDRAGPREVILPIPTQERSTHR